MSNKVCTLQLKRHSLLESLAQVVIGAVLSWLLTIYILPLWFDGIHIGPGTALEITLVYLAVSLARSYVIRRIGNRWSGWRS
jgi:hypothetical protein